MELRQLEYFVAVAEEANFTRAAARVRISQSGVSAQVRALEKELGAELFDRSGRTARLTEAGREALPWARTTLESVTGLRETVDQVRGLMRGHLTIGMVTGCEVRPLFAALAAFHRAYPAIGLELTENNSDQLVAGVRASRYDLALVGLAGDAPEQLAAQVIAREGLVALAPKNAELTARPQITLTELSTYPIVTLPEGTGIRTVLDHAFRSQGLQPARALAASAPGAVADLAARGLGIAVLSESMAANYPELTPVPIAGIELPALLALIWRPRVSAALGALLPHLEKAFGGTPVSG